MRYIMSTENLDFLIILIDIIGTIRDNYAYTGVSRVSKEQFICGRPEWWGWGHC